MGTRIAGVPRKEAEVRYARVSTSIAEFGELDPTGVEDCAPIINEAVETLWEQSLLTGLAQTLTFPKGKFATFSDIAWKTDVGIRGAGMGLTVFLPNRYISFAKALSPDPFTLIHRRLHFSHFTIDGQNQTTEGHVGSDEPLGAKGFWIQDVDGLVIDSVEVVNTGATGIGLGYLRRAIIRNCRAENCGRFASGSGGAAAGAGAGIATGLGRYYDESCLYLGNVSINNKTNGFFVENKYGIGNVEQVFTSGSVFIDNLAQGNKIGFKDCGSDGAIFVGNRAMWNKDIGFALHRSGANVAAGTRGRFANNVVCFNGLDYTTHLPTTESNRCGILLGTMGQGSYDIVGNIILDNDLYGISTLNNETTFHATGVYIEGNRIEGHKGSGILITYNNQTIKRLVIRNNRILNNGNDATLKYRDGITITAPTVYMEIIGNQCYDTRTVPTQQYGIALRGGATAMCPQIRDNYLLDNVNVGVYKQQRIVDETGAVDESSIRDNIEGATPTLPYALPDTDTAPARVRDSFNRADTSVAANALGNTDSSGTLGAKPWAVHSNSSFWQIANNQARPGRGGGTSTFVASFDNEAADVTAWVRIGVCGIEPVGGLIVRSPSSASGNQDGIRAWVRNDGEYTLSNFVDGNQTVLWDGGPANTWRAGDVIKLEAIGTTINFYVNDILLHSATNVTGNQNATRVGMVAGRGDLNFMAFTDIGSR